MRLVGIVSAMARLVRQQQDVTFARVFGPALDALISDLRAAPSDDEIRPKARPGGG
jgi:hypothetical protein